MGIVPQLRSNIVASLDAFVGRQSELEWLCTAVVDARLVTLVGPPGAGKTRLSRELAAQAAVRDAFDDIWFCDLSDAHSAEDVVDALAESWGIQVQGASLRERADSLSTQAALKPRALRILDNFETVMESTALVVLGWAGQLHHTFLVTSTMGLDVRGERELRVGPLPDDAAAALFIDRAFGETRRSHTAADVEVATRIAARLDGLPLAVELAARQAEILSVAEIEAHLDSAFDLLTSAPRDAPARHRSLHAMVAWGWEQLDDGERELMEAAAVFEGGFTAEALTAVVDLGEVEVRRRLLKLRRKSMLALADGQGDGTRLSLLNTLSTFARDRLEEHPTRLREHHLRHLRYYADLAQEWVATVHRLDRDRSRSVEPERANVVAALRRAVDIELDAADYDRAVHIALALRLLHDRRGVVHETPALLTSLLEAGLGIRGIAAGLRARLRAECGELRRRAGQVEGEAEVLEAVADARAAGDHAALALTLMVLGEVNFVRGDREAGLAAYEEALVEAKRAQDARLELDARQSLVVAKSFLGHSDADEHEEVYRLSLKVGDAWIEATCLTNMGIRHRAEGRLPEAISSFQTAIERFTELGDEATAAHVMLFLGVAHMYAGAFDEAERALERAGVSLQHRGPEVRHMADLAIARVQVARGDTPEAERMLDQILRETINDGAVETETLARTERFFLACRARDEDRIRAEAAAFPDLGGVRSFDARTHARAVAALVADLDTDGAAALDRLAEEVRAEEPSLLAYVLLQKAILAAIRGWRPGADSRVTVRAIRQRMDELAAELPGFDPQQVFPLRRWLQLLPDVGSEARPQLLVARNFSRVCPPDADWIDLSKKGRTRAVVRALIEARVASPGEPLTSEQIFACAWPQTSIRHESAMSRVYTAMSEIRKMGFAVVLQRTDVGYLIPPRVEVVFHDAVAGLNG